MGCGSTLLEYSRLCSPLLWRTGTSVFTAEVGTRTGFESSSMFGAAIGTKLEARIGVGIRF